MDQGNVLALAALVVALVALLNTVSQVLQQYFATADGYRRCSASVMGEWARFTRRKFKWRELRFETVFATPVIFLEVAYELRDVASSQTPIVVLDGTDEMSSWPGLKLDRGVGMAHTPTWSIYGVLNDHRHLAFDSSQEAPSEEPGMMSRFFRARRRSSIISAISSRTPSQPSRSTMTSFLDLDLDPSGNNCENEAVTWIPLMQSLQGYAVSLRKCGLSVFQDIGSGSLRHGRILSPAVRLSKKSWDFMAPEVIKPYAVTTIQDLAIFGQLLGLQWTSFTPEEGILRAEGHGILVTSAEVRSLGTLVSFVKSDKRTENRRDLHGIVFSPLEGAAALGFGIISSDLLGESFHVYSLDECRETMRYLSGSDEDFKSVSRPVIEVIMSDILGMITPVLRPVNTGITFLVKPFPFEIDGLVSLRGCLAGFTEQLEKSSLMEIPRSSSSEVPIAQQILKLCRAILKNPQWRPQLGRPLLAFRRYNDKGVLVLLDQLHKAWRDTSSWLSPRSAQCRGVLAAHIRAMLSRSHDILYIQRRNPLRYADVLEVARSKMAELYFGSCMQACLKDLDGDLGNENVMKLMEIWVAILFRGICWHAIHNFDDRVVAVAPRYHDSNLPVYVA